MSPSLPSPVRLLCMDGRGRGDVVLDVPSCDVWLLHAMSSVRRDTSGGGGLLLPSVSEKVVSNHIWCLQVRGSIGDAREVDSLPRLTTGAARPSLPIADIAAAGTQPRAEQAAVLPSAQEPLAVLAGRGAQSLELMSESQPVGPPPASLSSTGGRLVEHHRGAMDSSLVAHVVRCEQSLFSWHYRPRSSANCSGGGYGQSRRAVPVAFGGALTLCVLPTACLCAAALRESMCSNLDCANA